MVEKRAGGREREIYVCTLTEVGWLWGGGKREKLLISLMHASVNANPLT